MKQKLSQRVIWVGACLLSMTILAQTAFCEDARVLPQGRSRLNFTYAQTGNVSDTFNDQGDRVSLTHDYNLELNAATVQKIMPKIQGLVDGLNAQHLKYNPNDGVNNGSGQNLADALTRGFLGTDAAVIESQYNISYQYGVTDRLSVGFNVPIIKAQTTFNASITGTNTAQQIAAAFNQPGLPNQNALGSQLNQLANANIQTIRDQIQQSAGYTVPSQTNQSGIGDIVLGGRYNYYKSHYEDVISSVQAGVGLPTGSLKDPTIPTQISLGTGAFDLGIAHIFNYSPLRFLTLSNGIHYDHRLPSHQSMIPANSPGQVLPPTSNEESVATQLGDKYWTNLGVDAKITQAFSLGTSYEWFWKRPDTFSGSTPGVDYGGLSVDTAEYTETVQAGASLSTIPAFMRKEFPIPMDLAMNVYFPTKGVNAVIAPYATASIALYF
jgi:hypothetical protein